MNLNTDVPEGWEDFFKNVSPELKYISEFLSQEKGRIVPDRENIFRVFHMCPPEKVTVVVLGQDPYPQVLPGGKCQALGLSFSLSRDAPIQPSLMNIYKEISSNYPLSVTPNHGDISHWVSQGVFLLNASLTCRAGEPGSHSGKYKLWAPFMNKFVKYMSTINKNIIWVLWGKEAQKLVDMIDKSFVNILQANHPSGLSAYRGFFGCNHFKIINDSLKTYNKPIIHWLDQEIPHKAEFEAMTDMIPESQITEIIDFYNSRNEFNLEKKTFSLYIYLDSLYKLTLKEHNLTFPSYLGVYRNLLSKYRTIDSVNRAIVILYGKDGARFLYRILLQLSDEDVNSIIERYKSYYNPESGMHIIDFCVFGYIKGKYDACNFSDNVKFEDFTKKMSEDKEHLKALKL